MSLKHICTVLILTNILYVFFETVDMLNSKYDASYSRTSISAISAGFILLTVILYFVKNEELIFLQYTNRTNQQFIDLQQKQSEIVRTADREIRGIRHDLRNHIICLNELYKDNNFDELGKYIAQMSDSFEQICRFSYTGYDIADAVIRNKNSICSLFGGEIIVTGKLNGLKIRPIDMCTIVSNILDNAIDAVKNNKPDKRKIELSFKQTDSFIFISEKNYTIEKVVIKENRIKSTKKDDINHGLGLDNIRKAIEKYSGEIHLNSYEQKEDIIFTLEITLSNLQE